VKAGSSQELTDLYRALILDHSRSPRHFGRLEKATHTADGINPLCGDKLRLYLQIDRDGRIEASSFEGSGCAISVASASMLTDAINGLSVDGADACFDAITRRLAGEDAALGPGAAMDNLKALDGVREYPARVKCATLAWQALHAALQRDPATVTTE
jgi:nitrogen fixation NifU-like protein